MRAYSLAIAAILMLSSTWCQAQELYFATFGVKVASPEGMVRIPPGNMGHVARWAQLDGAGRPLAMVTLEIQPAVGRTVEQWAGESGGVGADVRAEPSKMGEYDATRFTKLAHPAELHLDSVYACRHGEYLWMAASYTSSASPDAIGLETLRQSIVFTEPEPPARHLDFSKEPRPIIGNIRANVPMISRPMAVKDAKTQVQFGIWNYRSNRDELIVSFDRFDRGFGPDPDTTANKWAKSLGRKYGMANPPRWHRLEGTVDKIIAEPILGKTERAGTSVRIVHGLAQIDADHTVLVICTITAESADQAAYQAAAERIIASVTDQPTQ